MKQKKKKNPKKEYENIKKLINFFEKSQNDLKETYSREYKRENILFLHDLNQECGFILKEFASGIKGSLDSIVKPTS